MDAGQEVEVLYGDLLLLNSQLVVQFPLGSSLGPRDRIGQVGARLGGDAERVRAASVGPHIGEGDLLGSPLLQQQLVLIVKEEDGEGAVKEPLVDVLHQMACKWGANCPC